ncbi:MAG: hypothetical protein NT085_04020 [candidate division SR1 bacterium]|nr:hypothetical protein [candidate division SR1 bacterium]
MKNILHHVHSHIKRHHRKYLFGLFGGYAVAKLFLLILGLSVVQYSYNSTFAQLQSGCVLTGQYYTGEYQTGAYLTGQELTEGTLINCVDISGYRTGGTLDEFNVLTGQTRIEEKSQTGCELTGQIFTGGYLTGSYLTGGYRTGGTLSCNEESDTEHVVQTGTNQTGTNQTGAAQVNTHLVLGNGICESGDVIWSAPISGSIVRNIFPISWIYSGSDCLSGLSLQLRDHNNQWINLSSLASGTTSYSFDSSSLYSFQQSGFYHIFGTGTTGQYYLYTGIATGTYLRLFTGYKLRLITADQTTIQETPTFTIDNQIPTITGMSLTATGFSTGFVNVSGVIILNFIASEELTGLEVTLGSGKIATSSTVSGLSYTYVRNLTSLYTEGILTPIISFADSAGNTGSVTYISSLTFDKTKPIVTGFVFTEATEGVHLNFSGSEPIKYAFTYQKTGMATLTGMSADYLTAQQLSFSGVTRDQLYSFTLDIFDRAGNSRAVTGDFMRTSLGQIISNVYVTPIATEAVLSGNLATLAVVLKAEVEKFNACKNALSYSPVELKVRNVKFVLQMPLFKKSQVKTLVNAFTLFVLDKIKNNYGITSTEITEITKKFDSFLVVLKLLRDDDNTCKQNLSNYHISQFKRALEEYKITLE